MTAKTGNDKRHAVTGLIGHVAAFWRSSRSRAWSRRYCAYATT